MDGQEESILGMHPVGVVRSKATGGDDAVHMEMEPQVLSPGVQDTEKANVRSQMFGVGGDFQQGSCTGAKQQVVEQPGMPLTE